MCRTDLADVTQRAHLERWLRCDVWAAGDKKDFKKVNISNIRLRTDYIPVTVEQI